MDFYKDEIKDLTDLGFEYPLRAYLEFNKFMIYDKVNRQVYPPKPSASLAWKEKEQKIIGLLVKLLNENVQSVVQVDTKPELEPKVEPKPVEQTKKRGRPKKN